MRLFRALLDHAIASAFLGDEEQILEDAAFLENILKKHQCTTVEFTETGSISVDDCLDRIDGTKNTLLVMISVSPVNMKCRTAIIGTIELLAIQGKKCCRSGGIWKACLQPIVEKWLAMREWEKECNRTNHWYCPLD